MKTYLALNGFGRVGRSFLRTLLTQNGPTIQLVALNFGPGKLPDDVVSFIRYDSVMPALPDIFSYDGTDLSFENHRIRIFHQEDVTSLPWKELSIDWVIEASGHFTQKADAQKHQTAGARKVLITAPSPSADVTIVPGVNDSAYKKDEHSIVSLASCTTNCLAPLIKVIIDTIGIEYASATTTHAYTNDQALLDGQLHHDLRRTRAAALNIVPTHTGAAQTIFKIFPQLAGKLHARALRVPVPKVSFLELTFIPSRPVSAAEVNALFEKAAHTDLRTVLSYSAIPLVSSDFSLSPASAIFDSTLTMVTGNLVTIGAWYDNEYGYAQRLTDFITHQGGLR